MKYVMHDDSGEDVWGVSVSVNPKDGEIELSMVDEQGEESLILCITAEGKVVIVEESNFAGLDIEENENCPDWASNNYIPVEYR